MSYCLVRVDLTKVKMISMCILLPVSYVTCKESCIDMNSTIDKFVIHDKEKLDTWWSLLVWKGLKLFRDRLVHCTSMQHLSSVDITRR